MIDKSCVNLAVPEDNKTRLQPSRFFTWKVQHISTKPNKKRDSGEPEPLTNTKLKGEINLLCLRRRSGSFRALRFRALSLRAVLLLLTLRFTASLRTRTLRTHTGIARANTVRLLCTRRFTTRAATRRQRERRNCNHT